MLQQQWPHYNEDLIQEEIVNVVLQVHNTVYLSHYNCHNMSVVVKLVLSLAQASKIAMGHV